MSRVIIHSVTTVIVIGGLLLVGIMFARHVLDFSSFKSECASRGGRLLLGAANTYCIRADAFIDGK